MAVITATMGSAFLASNEAFAVSLHAMGLFAFASPDVAGVEQINVVIRRSLTLHFDRLYCFYPVFFMVAIVEAVIARALGTADSVVMKALAVEFETVCFGAVTGEIGGGGLGVRK